jgi:hypothetical protein
MTPILVWHTHFVSYLLFVWMTRLKMGAATRAQNLCIMGTKLIHPWTTRMDEVVTFERVVPYII